MNKVCKTCGGFDICIIGHAGRTAECPEWRPGKSEPETNADRIRAMSDRELARFLCDLRKDCYECPAESFCHKVHTGMQDWLKQPAEGGLT